MYSGEDILDEGQLTIVHSSHGTLYLLTNISKRSRSPIAHTENSIVLPDYK